jgi:hypothetical protein
MVRFQRLFERRWLVMSISAAIALVSGLLLWATLQNAYWDYWLEPKLKAADPGLYIYPQLRYTVFDIVESLWCLDGLIMAGLSFRSVVSSRNITAVDLPDDSYLFCVARSFGPGGKPYVVCQKPRILT